MSELEHKNKNSEARIRANNKYNDKAYDRINIAVPKGYKAVIKECADSVNESVNEFVKKTIQERVDRMLRDKEDTASYQKYLQEQHLKALEKKKEKEAEAKRRKEVVESDVDFDNLFNTGAGTDSENDNNSVQQ